MILTTIVNKEDKVLNKYIEEIKEKVNNEFKK